MPDTRRLVIAGSVRLYCEGLVSCLRGVPGIEIVGIATRPADLTQLCTSFSPDVVIIDSAAASLLPALDDLRGRGIRTIALGIGTDTADAIACAERGLSAYVSREASLEDLVTTVERVVRGEIVLSPDVAGELWRRLCTVDAGRGRARPNGLTKREREVLALVREGCANKEIAARLRISVATVKNHVHRVLEKLGIERRGQAAAISSPTPGARLPSPRNGI